MPLPALPLDPANPDHQRWMDGVQGNVLKPHGRDHVRLLFFRFKQFTAENRKLFPDAIRQRFITSAWQQYLDAPGRSSDPNRPFYSVGLSNAGLWACGYGRDRDLLQVPPGFPPDPEGFLSGQIRMAVRPLGDPPRSDNPDHPDWEDAYSREVRGFWCIHGVWHLAHAKESALDQMKLDVTRLLDAHGAKVVAWEEGFRWRDAAKPELSREPFGFVDGISGPKFFLDEWPGGQPPPSPWSATALGQIFIDDAGNHQDGTFLVYRKLEQNVQAFRTLEARLAQALRARATQPNPPPVPASAAALLVGRERDGRPLAQTGPGGANDFDFGAGNAGDARCPFHAHIRKANPREPVQGETQIDDNHQFVRRSVVYDRLSQLPATGTGDYPEGGSIEGDVGLLFMAYLRHVTDQFERVHGIWFNRPDFPHPATCFTDPLLVPDSTLAGSANSGWKWQGVELGCFARFVRPRGGGYFYVPSLAWLTKPPS